MKIPRRAFFYYHSHLMPWMRWMSLYSFRKLNPDWEMVLIQGVQTEHAPPHHGPEKIDLNMSAGCVPITSDLLKLHRIHTMPDFADTRTPIPQHADQCRWRVLERFGGWWFDTDILFIDSMDSVAEQCSTADLAICLGREKADGLAMLGAAKGCSFIRECLLAANAVQDQRFTSAGRAAILRVLGMEPDDPRKVAVQARLVTQFPDCAITFMPAGVVYPWDATQLHQIFDADMEVPEPKNPPPERRVMGIHWFASAGRSHYWLKQLTAENFRRPDNNCTFTHYARNLIEDSGD